MSAQTPTVAAVSCNDVYSFTKPVRAEITLVAGLGVEGDVHAGVNVRHRSRVKADPAQPNLRQVHLIQGELFDEVRREGYTVAPGNLGENVTTNGIDLLGLPRGTILRFGRRPAASGSGAAPDAGGSGAVAGVLAAAETASLNDRTANAVEALVAAARRDDSGAGAGDPRTAVVITGMRNPCAQINGFRSGLLKQVLDQDADGNVVRKAGVMGVVLRGGRIRAGDQVTVELPPMPHLPLECI
jgi:MOSC domain-containing protein YiiM